MLARQRTATIVGRGATLLFAICCCFLHLETISFVPTLIFNGSGTARHHPRVINSSRLSSSNNNVNNAVSADEDANEAVLDRRSLLRRVSMLMATSATLLSTATATPAANAAADQKQQDTATIWLTGKAPKVPGQKPRDKGDVSGTKKDPKFLRSLADCKNQCENAATPDGYARSKEECLSECQDICCTTYEQCTFAIVPRI